MPLELAEGATVSSVIDEVRGRFPHLAPATVRIVTAVNAEYAEPTTLLSEGDEVVLIPPVSGGEP